MMAARGMSSADLMRATRLGSSQIIEYLNGHICPKADTLAELCRALDISADYLIGLSDYPENPKRRRARHD